MTAATQRNGPGKAQATQLIERPERGAVTHRDESGPLANLIDPDRFEHLQRLASLMASSTLTPKHLRGQNREEAIGNCFRVVNQALRWGFDPFAVADESYVVGGKLAYQGKLVAAVINSRAGLKARLTVSYTGSGDSRTCKLSGQFADEDEPRCIELTLKQARTDNKMFTTDPDQKLFYGAAIKWARRHCPEVVMGVLTIEEIEELRGGAQQAWDEARRVLELPKGRHGLRELQKAADAPQQEETGEIAEPEATAETDAKLEQDADGLESDLCDLLRSCVPSRKKLTEAGARVKEARETLGEARASRVEACFQECWGESK